MNQAVINAGLEYCTSRITVNLTPSRSFDARMQRLFRKRYIAEYKEAMRHRSLSERGVLNRVACACLSLVMFIYGGTGGSVIDGVNNYYTIYTYFEGTDYNFKDNRGKGVPMTLEKVYELSSVPEGYVFDGIMRDRFEITYAYISPDKQYVYFVQSTFSGKHIYDTENCIKKEIKINGFSGVLYYGGRTTSVIWDTDEYHFVLQTTGKNISNEELIKSAENIRQIIE